MGKKCVSFQCKCSFENDVGSPTRQILRQPDVRQDRTHLTPKNTGEEEWATSEIEFCFERLAASYSLLMKDTVFPFLLHGVMEFAWLPLSQQPGGGGWVLHADDLANRANNTAR